MSKWNSMSRCASDHLVGLARHPSDLKNWPTWLRSLPHGYTPLEAGMPLLPYSATTFLAPRVGAQSRVFEYGGGGSTVWFARRAGSVITIEHDEHWSEMIEHRLASLQVRNVSVRLIPPDVSTHSEKFRSIYDEGSFENYVKAIDDFPDASFDVVMVDGRARIACLERSIGKVRPGGVLVLDDSSRDRYQEAGSMLRSWQKHEFQGVRPTSVWTGTTSCWIRPI